MAAKPDGDEIRVRIERTATVISHATLTLSRSAMIAAGYDPDRLDSDWPGVRACYCVACYIVETGADAGADYREEGDPEDGITGVTLAEG